MSFSINLMTCKSDNRVVNKEVENVIKVEGTLREGSSILTPSILIDINSGISDDILAKCNYAQIDTFHRYYYVTNISLENYQLWRFDMKVDVLKSYYDDIIKQGAVIKRQETEANLLLSGADVPLLSTVAKAQYMFGGEDFAHHSIILATVGRLAGD